MASPICPLKSKGLPSKQTTPQKKKRKSKKRGWSKQSAVDRPIPRSPEGAPPSDGERRDASGAGLRSELCAVAEDSAPERPLVEKSYVLWERKGYRGWWSCSEGCK
ncbi:hypothetical protein JTE90_000578 [Oedothorax gibbosus]|uniref:Uncharacterized protein n=1 Tax=Oedothorax gibbosus TaxID=931172 RepID=A0AAV6VVC2_9ARAC|nr:hypothetical protein JTE90_000578 [Oedothorax gibbosus]